MLTAQFLYSISTPYGLLETLSIHTLISMSVGLVSLTSIHQPLKPCHEHPVAMTLLQGAVSTQMYRNIRIQSGLSTLLFYDSRN